jgi:tol-pal system protein YbgF
MRALPLIAPAAALLVTLLSGCATGPSPTQIRLDNLDTRVSKIERVVSSGGLVQLAQEQASLQAQVRSLRGRLDNLEQRDQRMSRQQRELYADLNRRVGALERASAAQEAAIQAASAAQTASAGSGGAGELSGAAGAGLGGSSGASASSSLAAVMPGVSPRQQSVYEQAFGALKAGRFSVAIRGFQGFLKTYPASPLAPNAEYWLGEAHYVNQNFNQAEKCFRIVLKKWPDSGKAAAALFDLGNTLIAQGKVRAGRAMLKKVTERYPGTALALRAATTLGQGGQ